MKTACSLLVLIASATYASASAGPPPFTNGSPLVSGVDGSYQATVRGKNLSGIFRFSYTSGNQTVTDIGNSYAIFADGQCYTGDVHAAINTDTVGGVFDTSDTENGNTASGFFNGSMDQNSAYASFSGEGALTLVNGTTNFGNSTSSASSFSDGSAVGNAATDGTGSTTTGDTASSTAVTTVDAGGSSGSPVVDSGSAASSTEAADSFEATTSKVPVIFVTRDFTFSGVRNSMNSQ